MIDSTGAGAIGPRAFLRIGGATLAAHQLGVARALNCRRVICIARRTSPELIALQHDAEAAGMQFHVLGNPQDLSGLVTANDEILVLTEGLFVDFAEAVELFKPGPAVLVQPVEGGLNAGFERIDLNHASAGMMLVPGSVVEGLHALPPDCDVSSALTRIALQTEVRMREVPLNSRAGSRWRMIGSESEAFAIENEWLKHHIGDGRGKAPGFLLARSFVSAFGPSLLHSGSASKSIAISILAVLAIAVGAGWFGAVGLGLLLAGAAWILVQVLDILSGLEGHSPGTGSSVVTRSDALEWLADGTLVLLAAWGTQRLPADGWAGAFFAPLMLVMLLRIVSKNFSQGFAVNRSGWLRDRALLCLALAAAAAFGVIAPVVQIAAVVLGFTGIVLNSGNRS